MEEFSNGLLEVLKYTIPALIVWATVYYMAKTYLQQRWNEQMQLQRTSMRKESIPMKIQALERLSLFCERIQPSQVVSRVRNHEMDAKTLGRAMLIAVQKEFEHNVTQQIYVSDPLWEIIYIAKNEVLNLITECMDEVPDDATGAQLATVVIQKESAWQLNPARQALQAIRKEASVILTA
jgi:hypothetical protein